MCTMRTLLQRLAAGVALSLLAATGFAAATTWGPVSAGFVAPASADDDDGSGDDDDDGSGDDDDGGQVPAGGVDTGQGGTTSPADDSDDDGSGDDDGGQVPAGGVDTGQGGAAEAWAGEPASSDRSAGIGDVVGTVAPIAALGLGALVAGRLALARLRGSQG
jgi:hypothetical protein